MRRRDRRYAVAFAQDQSGELPGSPTPGVTPRTAGYVLGIESAVQLPLLSACVVTSWCTESSGPVDLADRDQWGICQDCPCWVGPSGCRQLP